VSHIERNWKFVEQYHQESEILDRTRRLSLELGVQPVSTAVAAELGLLSLLTKARHICEIGTGVGVSGLALLATNPEAHLTTIDIESEHLRAAREQFTEAGIASSRLRVISGDALTVLPRLNVSSYDLVLVDADPLNMLEYVEHALRMLRPGGLVLVPRALWNGSVSDPAARDAITEDFRTLLNEMASSDAVHAVLNPSGDGLLVVAKLGTT